MTISYQANQGLLVGTDRSSLFLLNDALWVIPGRTPDAQMPVLEGALAQVGSSGAVEAGKTAEPAPGASSTASCPTRTGLPPVPLVHALLYSRYVPYEPEVWSIPVQPPFEFDVFLSHSSADKPFVRTLATRLRAEGLRVFFDEDTIPWGEAIQRAITGGLTRSRHMILVMSPDSVGIADQSGSAWVETERLIAQWPDPANRSRRLLPLLLRACDIPAELKPFKYLDISTTPRLDSHWAQIVTQLRQPPPEHRKDDHPPDSNLSEGPIRALLVGTVQDLLPHREVVAGLARALGLELLGYDPHRGDDYGQVREELVARAEMVVVLTAWRYGVIPQGASHSVPHQEFLSVSRRELPVIVALASKKGWDADLFDDKHLAEQKKFRAELVKGWTPLEFGENTTTLMGPMKPALVAVMDQVKVQRERSQRQAQTGGAGGKESGSRVQQEGDPLAPIKHHLKEDANCLAGIFTRVGGPQVLSDVYVELRLNAESLRDQRQVAPGMELFDYRGPQKLEEVITRQDRRRWIVLGDPGSGKTTLLHHLVLQLLEKGRALPLYLKVGDVCDAGSLEDALTHVFGTKNKALAWAEVQAGRAVVLLDGLDEALDPANARTRVIAAASEVGESVLVVASRKVGYDTNPLPVSFGELHLLDLDDRAQEDLLGRWVKPGTDVTSTLTRLRRHERMKRMVGNPLLLTLVGLLLREREPVPEKRGLLYRSALTLLMKREHTVGGATRRLREPATAERLLAQVAPKLHGLERDTYPTADVARVLSEPAVAVTLRPIWGGPESFLEEVAVTTGLLVPDRSRSFAAAGYTFPHRTFREYLAAVGLEEDIAACGVGAREAEKLVSLMTPGGKLSKRRPRSSAVGGNFTPPNSSVQSELTRVLTEAKTKPSTWSEVLALTCGLLGRGAGDALVRRVAKEGSPELTLRVVAEAEGIREDTVSLVLGLDTDPKGWESRKDVLQQIPTLVGDAGSAARLIWKFIQQTSNGNDLFWSREVLHTIHRGEATTGPLGTSDADKADALDYATRIFDHLRGERWEQARAILEGQWVDVPAGTFWMGNTEETDPEADDDEAPRHPVTLTRPFRLQKYQVTNSLYELFDPSHEQSRERWEGVSEDELAQHPVVNVTWYEATMFAEWLGATLPTEAQWEWAARGPEARKYPWGKKAPTPKLANYDEGGPGRTAPVGSYPLGASWVGALDMAGNVSEWCQDWYDSYPPGEQVDPTGPSSGSLRVMRGGSWINDAAGLRSSVRDWDVPSGRDVNQGFRVALPPGHE